VQEEVRKEMKVRKVERKEKMFFFYVYWTVHHLDS